jgi:homoserine dehydrogenase
MSAVLAEASLPKAALAPQEIALVLLGTGVVGGAFLKLLCTPVGKRLHLVGVANSRKQ